MSFTGHALIDEARFQVTKFREGYDMENVDSLLEKVSALCKTADVNQMKELPTLIADARFQVTKFREGYDMVEVDDFLDEITSRIKLYVAGDPSGGLDDSVVVQQKPSKFPGLSTLLNVEFPEESRGEGYAKKDVDNFVSFLEMLDQPGCTSTVAEALQVAEHLSPKSAGFFSKGYDKQHVDAFLTRVVTLLKTL